MFVSLRPVPFVSNVCAEATSAADLLKQAVTKPGLALVVIDSKLSASDPEAKCGRAQ
jgi:hypothetical protein